MAEAKAVQSGHPEETRAGTPGSPAAQHGSRPAPGQGLDAGGRTDPPEVAQPVSGRLRSVAASRRVREAVVLAAYLAAGIVVTWPRATYLRGLFPNNNDQAQYIWDLWWVTHQLVHLGNPWFTTHMAAPVGTSLGFDTLMPLLGVLTAPVTLAFGPAVSYNLLTIALPGLACYAMYRVARLWLPGMAGAVAAGGFFGLSSMLTYQNWRHIGVAAGCVFMLLALEAAVRLRRGVSVRRGVILGAVLGASLLVNQETVILAVILAGLALGPWLLARPSPDRLRALTAGAVAAVAVASPQLIAMIQQAPAVGHLARRLPRWDAAFGVNLTRGLFTPSPRVADFGLTGLASVYHFRPPDVTMEGVTTFGLVLSVLAVLGLAASWRRRSAWLLAALWLGSAALALGLTLRVGARTYAPLAERWHHVRVSMLMPYTWFVRMPGLTGFREADRLALLGLAGAALLAGAAVTWLRSHAWPVLIVVAVLAALEAGWSGAGAGAEAPLPTALPALDRPIAADHSGSTVVDVPFGLSGGVGVWGTFFVPAEALVMATADGHPRAISFTSWVDFRTVAGFKGHPFYLGLRAAEHGRDSSPALLAAARRDLRSLDVGWLLVWDYHRPSLTSYLAATGFSFAYRADGALVYRPRWLSWRSTPGQVHPTGTGPAGWIRAGGSWPARPVLSCRRPTGSPRRCPR